MKTWTAEEIVAKFQYSFACTEESFDVDGFTVEMELARPDLSPAYI